MDASDIPAKFNIPWASSAGGSYITSPIPEASQIGITNGAASLTDGFPPLNFQPVESGGVPPFGADSNGILKEITLWNQWQQAGGVVPYDGTFQTAIGGYPKGAIVASGTVAGLLWQSTTDDNATDPDTGGAGWVALLAAPNAHYGVDSGAANAYVVGVVPQLPVVPAFSGLLVSFLPTHTNTTASTLNVGWGTVAIVQANGLPLSAGLLVASTLVTAVYDQPSNKFYLLAGAAGGGGGGAGGSGGITGLLPSSIGASTVTVGAGSASDSTGATVLTLASPLSWSVATGNNPNGFHGGTTLPNSSTISFAECGGASGSCIFADTQYPVRAPAGYTTYQRRIFSMLTAAAGNQFHASYQGATAFEVEGGAMEFYLSTQLFDVNRAAISSGARTLYTLSLPAVARLRVIGRGFGEGSNSANSIIFTSPDEADVAPGTNYLAPAVPGWDVGGAGGVASVDFTTLDLTTNASAQIGARTAGSNAVSVDTRGFIDFRRD